MQPKDQEEVIEIEDYREISRVDRPELDVDQEVITNQLPPDVRIYQARGNGGCCCFSLSGMVLLILGIFVLGLLALCWLTIELLGWASPF